MTDEEEKKELLKMFESPSDNNMRDITCALFKTTYEEANVIYKKRERSQEIKRLENIIDFCNDKDNYWWKCLSVFCPDLDESKIKNKIINSVEKTYCKI